jgi:hypothetical protein
MKTYKIRKEFQGGCGLYYANLPAGKKVINWHDQLERWGEFTDGGHCYGYRMYADIYRGKSSLKNKGMVELMFAEEYLETVAKKVKKALKQPRG